MKYEIHAKYFGGINTGKAVLSIDGGEWLDTRRQHGNNHWFTTNHAEAAAMLADVKHGTDSSDFAKIEIVTVEG